MTRSYLRLVLGRRARRRPRAGRRRDPAARPGPARHEGRRPHRVRGHDASTEFEVEIIGVLENIGPRQSMILARLDGRAAREDRRHRRHERQPRLHRRQAGGRGRLRLPVLQGDDRRHHAHRGDDRGHGAGHAARRLGALPPAHGAGRTGGAARPPRRSSAALRRPLRTISLAARRLARRPAPPAAWPARRSRRCRCRSSSPASTRPPSSGRASCSRAWASRPVMGTGGRSSSVPGPLPDLAAGRARRRLAGRGRPRPLGHRHRHAHRRRPRLRLRPSLLQPGTDAVPDEEGLRLLGVPQPLPVLEDQRARRRQRGHHRPGPHHRDRRPPGPAAAHDPGRGPPGHQPRPGARRSRSASWRTSCSRPVLAYVSAGSRCCRRNERDYGTSTSRSTPR